MNKFMIYGAYGYTGVLVVEEALRRGLRPVLGGRNEAKLKEQASRTGLEYRVFSLDSAEAVDNGLAGMQLVIHCAGPFSHTARAMAEGCLRQHVHYLDITGEIEVFQLLESMDARAREAGIMLLPGAGFDVVPTDCLAAHLKQRLPEATQLTLAFYATFKPSHGTLLTMVESSHRGCVIRKNGKLTAIPSASKARRVNFGPSTRTAIAIPWGDVFTAYYSTGIPNIEVYMAGSRSWHLLIKSTRYFHGLLARESVRRFLQNRVKEGGQSAEARARGYCLFWGEASDEQGNRVEARLRTPDAYALTALTTILITKKVFNGSAPAGFNTPSMAYGPDLIWEVQEVTRLE